MTENLQLKTNNKTNSQASKPKLTSVKKTTEKVSKIKKDVLAKSPATSLTPAKTSTKKPKPTFIDPVEFSPKTTTSKTVKATKPSDIKAVKTLAKEGSGILKTISDTKIKKAVVGRIAEKTDQKIKITQRPVSTIGARSSISLGQVTQQMIDEAPLENKLNNPTATWPFPLIPRHISR